jgi:glyoxylase-like metal-dependent hydrolase (beta-lactamase superfamily II)
MEIVPGIYQIEVPIPNSPIGPLNAYLVRGNNGWLLIDTGWDYPEAFDSLEGQLKEKGLDFDAISRIVVTHTHIDHYGLIGRLKKLSKAETAFHEKEFAFIEAISLYKEDYPGHIVEQMRCNGVPEEEYSILVESFTIGSSLIFPLDPPDVILQGGETIKTGLFNFEVIWTPGHSSGHICLYEPSKKILLSGDHILPIITPNISIHPYSSDNPLKSYLASLKEVDRLDVDIVLPGHEHIFTDLHKRIGELFSHHEQRVDDILNVIRDEEKTAYQIASEVPWILETEGGKVVCFADLAVFDRGMATGETLAHLEYLRMGGKVKRISREGIAFYKISVDKKEMKQ